MSLYTLGRPSSFNILVILVILQHNVVVLQRNVVIRQVVKPFVQHNVFIFQHSVVALDVVKPILHPFKQNLQFRIDAAITPEVLLEMDPVFSMLDCL